MTRINLVHVKDLADQHLFAEWREIKMIPAKIRKLHETKSLMYIVRLIDNAPHEYTLGTGHVTFFYDKMHFLFLRYQNLTTELLNRNYNINLKITAYDIFLNGIVEEHLDNNWKPTTKEVKINIDRISERLYQRPYWYRYYGEIKPPDFFADRYTQQLLVDTIIA